MQKIFISLFLFFVLLSALFLELGGGQIFSESQARFAEIGREIVASDRLLDWVIQPLNGEVYSRKPPLFPALVAASYTLFGQVNEFTAALPSAFFAMLTVLLCFFFWKRFFGVKVAFMSSLLLATSYKFVDQARSVQVDMVFLFFLTAALFCAYCFLEQERLKMLWSSLFFFSASLAILTKGPIGLLLPAALIFCYAVYAKKVRALFSKEIFIGSWVFLFLIGGWIGFLFWKAPPGYLHNLFILENVTRYVDAFDHQAGFFYYFTAFPSDFLPWILFLPFLFFSRSWRQNETRFPLSFFWICFVGIFFFFTLSESKRGLYLLPLYPSVCLLLGNGWSHQSKKWGIFLLSLVTILAASYPFALDQYLDHKEERGKFQQEKIELFQEAIGDHEAKAYRFMEPVILFYMKRALPVLNQEAEVETYFQSKEPVFLILNKTKDAALFQKLSSHWHLVLSQLFKDEEYVLFQNQVK